VPVDCNHEVCGVVLPTITCTSDSDCYGQANKCVGGLCNKCTNPGTACCDGSCRPEGWGCAPAKNCYYTQSCVKQACLGWNGEGCGEYQVQETIACGSECRGVPCKDSAGNDITCGAYLEHPWCDEHCDEEPNPTLTPTPQPFSCDQISVTNLRQSSDDDADMAEADISNDSGYPIYLTHTWFSWYDGINDPTINGFVDYFALSNKRATYGNYWGGADNQAPDSLTNPTEVDSNAVDNTRLEPHSSDTWLVDVDGGLVDGNNIHQALNYGRVDACLSFTAYSTDKGTVNCYNKCVGYDGQALSYCGDGVVQSPNAYGENEECDDGNQSVFDTCDNNCQLTYCGDSYTQDPNGDGDSEQCDDANSDETDQCNNTCQLTYCGDGIVQSPNGHGGYEDCDEGINNGSGYCSATCQVESWWQSKGGLVYANDLIKSIFTNSTFLVTADINGGGDSTAGLALTEGDDSNIELFSDEQASANLGSDGTTADDNPRVYQAGLTDLATADFSYFKALIGERTNFEQVFDLGEFTNGLVSDFSSSLLGQFTDVADEVSVARTTADLTLDLSDTWTPNGNYLIMVDGDLNINNTNDLDTLIQLDEGNWVAFVVSGDININSNVGFADVTTTADKMNLGGLFLADGKINIQSDINGDKKFIGHGSFIGLSGVSLNREFSDTNTRIDNPTEVFVYRPDLYVNTPKLFQRPFRIWQEVL